MDKKLRVHNEEGYLDLMNEMQLKLPISQLQSETVEVVDPQEELKKQKKLAKEADFLEQSEKEKNERLWRQREKRKREEAKFDELCRSVDDGERNLVPDITRYLNYKDRNDQMKMEKLYIRWLEKVFLPMQSQIDDSLTRLSTEELEERNRGLFEEFLKNANSKAGMFRDIIIESEYDPLKNRETTIRFKQDLAEDPTWDAVTRVVKEEISPGQQDKSVRSTYPVNDEMKKRRGKGRELLDTRQWDKLDATPYGRYGTMMESASQPKLCDKSRESRVVFDHYNIQTGREVMMSELPKGKKVYPE